MLLGNDVSPKLQKTADLKNYHFQQLGFFGLHIGIGPPSCTVINGDASAEYAPTKPTIRINILTARFMGSILLVQVPGSGTFTPRIIGLVVPAIAIPFFHRGKPRRN